MKKYLVAAVAALALIGGVAAYASIPDASGVVNSCYRNTDGDLRVSDMTCRSDETALVLNGIGGYEVVSNSFTFTAGNSDGRNIACSTGRKVLGGGFEYVSGAAPSNLHAITSTPDAGIAWLVRIQVQGSTDLTAKVYAICAKVN